MGPVSGTLGETSRSVKITLHRGVCALPVLCLRMRVCDVHDPRGDREGHQALPREPGPAWGEHRTALGAPLTPLRGSGKGHGGTAVLGHRVYYSMPLSGRRFLNQQQQQPEGRELPLLLRCQGRGRILHLAFLAILQRRCAPLLLRMLRRYVAQAKNPMQVKVAEGQEAKVGESLASPLPPEAGLVWAAL